MTDNVPVEITDQKPQENPPIQVAATGTDLNAKKIEIVEASIPEEENVTVLAGPDDKAPTIRTAGQPLTDDDKRLAQPNPETIIKEEPKGRILEPAPALKDIPGVKEVKIIAKDQPYKDMQVSVPEAVKSNLNARKFFKEMLKGGVINQIIHKYGLEGIDLEKEKAKIEKKASGLSASKRKAVIALCNMREQQRALMKDVAKNFTGKADPTEEELKELLDSVEDNVTNTGHAAEIVAQEVVDRAQKTLEETAKPKVEEVLKEAEVSYSLGDVDEAFQKKYSEIFHTTDISFTLMGHLESNKPTDVFDIQQGVKDGDIYLYTTMDPEEEVEDLHDLIFLNGKWWIFDENNKPIEFVNPEVAGVDLV